MRLNIEKTRFASMSKALATIALLLTTFILNAQNAVPAGNYYDTGGATGSYQVGDEQFYKICPSDKNKKVIQLEFTEYDITDGVVLTVSEQVKECNGNLTTLSYSGAAGQAISNSPGGGLIVAHATNPDGCLTVKFDAKTAVSQGKGYKIVSKEINRPNYNFPNAGQIIRLSIQANGCDGIVDLAPQQIALPVYQDNKNCGLVMAVDCGEANIAVTGNFLSGTAPYGITNIKFTSPITGESVTYQLDILPKNLAVNDVINISLSNSCISALTPDIFLEDPCMDAKGIMAYEIKFQNPHADIIDKTIEGYPIIDFSNVPCGTRLDVLIERTVKIVCSNNNTYTDRVWSTVIIEDKIPPVIVGEPFVAQVPCYYDTDDLLRELNKLDASAKTISLYPTRADRNKAGSFIGKLSIPAIADQYEIVENCDFDKFRWSKWVEVHYNCTEGTFNLQNFDNSTAPGFQISANLIDILNAVLARELAPPSVFKAFIRTVQAVDKCGNKSIEGFQIVEIIQPDIKWPLFEIKLECKESADPIDIYNRWASDPVKFAHYGAMLPNFDPTPVNSQNFGQVLNLEDLIAQANLSNGSGDEVPAYLEHADCGYAADWKDSKNITLCAHTYKIFREWTVYNWCDGHLEIIGVIPQVITVGDTEAPFIVGEIVVEPATGVTDPSAVQCLTDALISFEAKDACSEVIMATISINGNEFQPITAQNGKYSIKNVPVLEPFHYTIRLKDECNNVAEFKGTATLDDHIVPVAICEKFRTVSMGLECTTVVRAEVFDDGSYDNCGQITFAVACKDDLQGDYKENYHVFQPTITFTSKDMNGCIGKKTVVFRVADGAGVDLNKDGDFDDEGERYPNFNYCEVEVELQDRIPPVLEDQSIILDCASPAATALATALANGQSAVQALLNSGNFVDANGVAYITSASDNCDNITFLIDRIDASGFNTVCQQGTIRINYQATDACGNVSLPAIAFINIVAASDWVMKFPYDYLFENCAADFTIPAAATINDILINNGCDDWGLNVTETEFSSGGGIAELVREYHLINFCSWNPSNTEIAIIERPQDLILQALVRDYRVSLRYRDQRAVALDANGNVQLDANGNAIVLNDGLGDGINDIDDGNENDDFATIANSNGKNNRTVLNKSLTFDYARPNTLYRNPNTDRTALAPINIPFSSEQLRRINDVQEALEFDLYDVTRLPFDGDFVVIDNFDQAYDGVKTFNEISQFTGDVETYVSAQHYGNIIYRQIIRILDPEAPTIDVPAFDAFCAEGDCFGKVVINFKATDPCTGTVDCQYGIKTNFGTPTELDFGLGEDTFGALIDLGEGNFRIEGNYPIGIHEVTINATDAAGNTSTYTFEFEVKDCEAPVAKCVLGLVIDLMHNGKVSIPVEWFNKGSYDKCSGDVKLTFANPTIYPDSTVRTFNCNNGELGLVGVTLWVSDKFGNTSFCETFVNIQNNPQNGTQLDLCPTPGASIGGSIATSNGNSIEKVEVNLSGNTFNTSLSDANGAYRFNSLTEGYDYTITPHKDNDVMNGISTFDLLILSKHILGTTLLTSPYQLIAADVNNSGTITTFDMIELRKLILGVSTQFPNNTAWRFIPKDYQFKNPANPLAEDFPEVLNFNDLTIDELNANFIAIKIGDLNGSATATSNSEVENRTSNTQNAFAFRAKDQQLEAGQTTWVDFTAAAAEAFQFTMEFKGMELLEVKGGVVSLEHFGIFNQAITTSWNTTATNTHQPNHELGTDNEIMFSLLVRATERIRLSEALAITSSITRAESYANNAMQSVALHFEPLAGFEMAQNFPNPFQAFTTINITSPEAQSATLKIHDLNGRVLKVMRLQLETGNNEVKVKSEQLPKGILYYTLETSQFKQTRKMAVL